MHHLRPTQEREPILEKRGAERPFFQFSNQGFISRAIFLYLLLMVLKEFFFQKILHFSIPGFNSLSLSVLVVVLLAVGRPQLRWNRHHAFLLLLFTLFAVLNHLVVGWETKRFLGGWYRTIQPALLFGFFYLIDLDRKEIEKILIWTNHMVLSLLLIALIDGFFFRDNPMGQLLRKVTSLYPYYQHHSAWLSINVGINLFLFRSNGKKRHVVYTLISIAAIIMTGMRKSFVSAVLIGGLFLLLDGDWKAKIKKVTFALSGVLLYLLFFGQFLLARARGLKAYAAIDSGELQARTAMNITSVKIANDYFPWGSGLGTYASHPAAFDYSVLYYKYNLSGIRGIEPYAGKGIYENFLLDTYWPHIIGELGYIGTLLFLVLWLFPLFSAWRLPSGAIRKNLLFFIAAIWGAIFLESTGSTYPEQLQFILVYCGITALLLRQAHKETYT